jgi:ADP-dependent NAD(P)H-hydrate dehydratase
MSPYRELSEAYLRSNSLPSHENGNGKEARGRVLVISGNARVPGAAILAGEAALRAGAGILQIVTCASVSPHIGVAVPEAMVLGFSETPQGEINQSNAMDIAALAKDADAVVVGPGMMDEDALRPLVMLLLGAPTKARIVLDAAAFTCMNNPSLNTHRSMHAAIVTPHAGEMARFLGLDRGAIEREPLDAAQRVASCTGSIVVMKGAETFIVGEEVWRSRFGSVALATSGSGDVLAGVLGGILARGVAPTLAALWAVFLHGEAGERLSRKFGNVGALARELAAEIPQLMSRPSPTRGEHLRKRNQQTRTDRPPASDRDSS